MKDEIILTDKNNTTISGVPFPKTPRPKIYYDGIFLTKEQRRINSESVKNLREVFPLLIAIVAITISCLLCISQFN